MNRQTEAYIKAGVAGVLTGGLAFLAVNSLCSKRSHRSFKRMTAAKTFKLIGNLMDNI